MKPIHLFALAAAGLLAGCGSRDARLEQLTVGISKDSALALMGIEKPKRIDPYLVAGKYIEIMYFNPGGAADSVPDRETSPLIAVDGVLRAWGWNSLDSLSAATKIQVAPK
jgi:hypothetical protein